MNNVKIKQEKEGEKGKEGGIITFGNHLGVLELNYNRGLMLEVYPYIFESKMKEQSGK